MITWILDICESDINIFCKQVACPIYNIVVPVLSLQHNNMCGSSILRMKSILFVAIPINLLAFWQSLYYQNLLMISIFMCAV